MAIVYFVREGTGKGCSDQGREISLSEIARSFPFCEPMWSQESPVFNANYPVNPVSEYRFVVVEVQREECTGKFTKEGYWILDKVSPSEFERKMRVDGADENEPPF